MNPDLHALLDKATDSLAAAGSLMKARHFDFAVSREYYAMFYVAETLLADLGQSYSKHAGVISAFGREYAKSGRLDPKFHRWLIDAQDLRNIGAYGIEAHVSEEQAALVCQWAREFLRVASELLKKRDP